MLIDPRRKKWLNIALREPMLVARLLKNRVRKKFRLDYRFGNGYGFLPYAVIIVPTYRCNLRCRMCNQYEGDFKKSLAEITPGQDEMTLAQWKTVIDELARWKPSINIFGGEPLLYEKIIDLIAYIKSKNLNCSISTNGVLLARHAEALLESKIESVNVSLDGPEAIHNFIRGGNQFYQKTIEGIRALQALKRAHLSAIPRININCVITEWNYDHLPEVVAIAETLQIDALEFQHIIFTSAELCQANRQFFERTFGCPPQALYEFPVIATDKIAIPKLAATIAQFQQEARQPTRSVPIRVIPNIKLADLPQYYQQLNYRFENHICVIPWVRTQINPNGDVTPCMGYVIGNVKTQPLAEMWNTPRAKHFRAELKKHGLFPGCVRCCHRRYNKAKR